MTVFVDTSAFLAIMDADDSNHQRAKKKWVELLEDNDPLLCSNYILIETFALVQHRLGMKAVVIFQNDVVPVLQVHWVGEELHRTGVAALLAARRRQLSLVDCVSFEVMRQAGLDTAFAFDSDFASQGFRCIPLL